jgi:hypothetical protein
MLSATTQSDNAITCAVAVLGLVAVALFGWIARLFQERHKLRERVAELEAELRALRQADLKRRETQSVALSQNNPDCC